MDLPCNVLIMSSQLKKTLHFTLSDELNDESCDQNYFFILDKITNKMKLKYSRLNKKLKKL